MHVTRSRHTISFSQGSPVESWGEALAGRTLAESFMHYTCSWDSWQVPNWGTCLARGREEDLVPDTWGPASCHGPNFKG